jgi:hypothetical protein
MAKAEREFFDADLVPARGVPGSDTLHERILSEDPASGDDTGILIMDPGSDTSPLGVQAHDYWEEVWILAGSLRDLTVDRTFHAGQYACRPPGMRHGPWQAPDGCTMLVFRYGRVRP